MSPRLPPVIWLSVLLVGGCTGSDPIGTACPLIGPGPSPGLTLRGEALIDGEMQSADVAAGHLVAFDVDVAQGSTIAFEVIGEGSAPSVYLYGPRDAAGAVDYCADLAVASPGSGRVMLELDGGEEASRMVVAMGPRPGEPGGRFTLQVTCTSGCEASAPCDATPSCPLAPCAGYLALDDEGCPTCSCETGTQCAPDRSPGPMGACVLPMCQVNEGDDNAGEVCGVDGNTYASLSAALCAGVTPAFSGGCEALCPDLNACEAPCFGERVIDAMTGCPTCDCAAALPASAADCATCSAEVTPVCGADGVTYTNRCVARCSGTKILYAAACVTSCTASEELCELDCPWGLALEEGCVACRCALSPTPACETSGDQVCATLPGFEVPTTLGSTCLAQTLGASDIVRGPCGLACESDADCPEIEGAALRCAADDPTAPRCIAVEALNCGCSALALPVCTSSGVTRVNRCEAACAGERVIHEGACCEASAPPSCPEGEHPALDTSGCIDAQLGCIMTPQPEALDDVCLDADEWPEACDAAGEPLGKTTCEAHALGLVGSHRWCAP